MICERYQPCRGGDEFFWSGYIADQPEPGEFPKVTREGDIWVVKVEEQVVCRASSVRQNEYCAEVYVETHPDFRRRGFGRQVVAAWAQDTLSRGQVPFYSYHMSNRASAALARSLGFVWYADAVSYGASDGHLNKVN